MTCKESSSLWNGTKGELGTVSIKIVPNAWKALFQQIGKLRIITGHLHILNIAKELRKINTARALPGILEWKEALNVKHNPYSRRVLLKKTLFFGWILILFQGRLNLHPAKSYLCLTVWLNKVWMQNDLSVGQVAVDVKLKFLFVQDLLSLTVVWGKNTALQYPYFYSFPHTHSILFNFCMCVLFQGGGEMPDTWSKENILYPCRYVFPFRAWKGSSVCCPKAG